MKAFLMGIILLWCASSIRAQYKNDCGAIYFDSIPLYIQSDFYGDRLNADKEFITISEKVKIYLVQREKSVCGNTVFKLVQICINKFKLSGIEYRLIHSDPYLSSPWKSLTDKSLLTEISILPDQKIAIQFRWKRKKSLIQQTIIKRPDWSPLINAYRQRNQGDSFDNKLKSNAAYKTRQILSGFKPLKDSKVILQPGKQVELQFDSHDLSIDSCIEYRLRNSNENFIAPWRNTGHVLNVRSIRSNNDYVLETRYKGQRNIKTYFIYSLAYWWQRPLSIIFFIVTGMLIITSGSYFLINRKRLKIKESEEKLKQQLKSGQSKLNPHFVFNAMSSIGGLVSSEQNDRAEEYLNTFSDIMRTTLSNSNHLFIPLSEELDSLQKYIELEQLGYEFRFELNIDPDLNLDSIEFPPMLLQPSLENAVKHGVADLEKDGNVRLVLIKQNYDLVIIIQDNGKPSNKKPTKTGGGHGIALTKERIEILGKLFPNERIIYGLELNVNGAIASFRFGNWLA